VLNDIELASAVRSLIGTSVPGMAVLIVDEQGIRARTGVGVADLASGTKATTWMSCPWFSMTKLVTVTAALRLSEAGTLDLDEPAHRHVAALKLLSPAIDGARITARHLMSHSAGLANPMPLRWIHPAHLPGPELEEMTERLLREHGRLRFEPGSKASYTNLGTLVLGLAMQRASGIEFTELIRREVLRPLDMLCTGFTVSSESPRATAYHQRVDPMRFLLPRWVTGTAIGRWLTLNPFLVDGKPYGGLVGPLEDAARFLRMHVCDGALDGKRHLAPSTVEGMRVINSPGRRFDFGLGWFRPRRARSADPPFVEHLGGGAGFHNVMRLYPTRRIGIVVMGNATRYNVDAVAALALR
jgi:CubicO group peptidase (beta-lactamase class C family)